MPILKEKIYNMLRDLLNQLTFSNFWQIFS